MKTITNCEEDCKDYHAIPHDTGIALYCARYDAMLDDELIEKCDRIFNNQFTTKKQRNYFVK